MSQASGNMVMKIAGTFHRLRRMAVATGCKDHVRRGAMPAEMDLDAAPGVRALRFS